MAFQTLDQFKRVKEFLSGVHKSWLWLARGISVPTNVKLSLSARLIGAERGSITVGECTLIAFKALIYTWDPVSGENRPVSIGSNCFIGGGSVITPGVRIGDECIVGAGSVVFEDLPNRTVVGGNPARVLRQGVELRPYGVMPVAKENTQQLWRP